MATTHVSHHIAAGTLDIHLSENGHRLDELLAFASRQNPKRGFLFVSRVLGKHLPVRPSIMDRSHAELAERIQLMGCGAYVIGMAETAVGLGAGVARHLSTPAAPCLYQHTSRFLVESPWIRFQESHSHADSMHLATPSACHLEVLPEFQDLVLVDDEITTGRTLAQLAHGLLQKQELRHVRRLHIVSLVNWIPPADRRAFCLKLKDLPVDVHFVQLMAGAFEFTPDPDYRPVLPEYVDTECCSLMLDAEGDLPQLGQDALFGTMHLDIDSGPSLVPPPGLKLAVLGMGEYLDRPHRMALKAERAGRDVLFQSSSRSPIALGDCIARVATHPAPGRPDKRHFLYNAAHTHTPWALDGLGQPDIARALETDFSNGVTETSREVFA